MIIINTMLLEDINCMLTIHLKIHGVTMDLSDLFYSYRKVDNKLYTYGESGITIITMNIINPKIIKIPNDEYYESVRKYGRTNKYANSLGELSNIYGEDFIILDRLEELDSNDYSIVKELIEQDEDKTKKSSSF